MDKEIIKQLEETNKDRDFKKVLELFDVLVESSTSKDFINGFLLGQAVEQLKQKVN